MSGSGKRDGEGRLGPLMVLVLVALGLPTTGRGDDDNGQAEPAAIDKAQTETAVGGETESDEPDKALEAAGLWE